MFFEVQKSFVIREIWVNMRILHSLATIHLVPEDIGDFRHPGYPWGSLKTLETLVTLMWLVTIETLVTLTTLLALETLGDLDDKGGIFPGSCSAITLPAILYCDNTYIAHSQIVSNKAC